MEQSFVLRANREPYLHDLFFIDCGISKNQPLHSFGPTIRETYVIHIILKGKGILVVNEEKYLLSKGDGFLIEPAISSFYQADIDEPWNYLWIQFAGTAVSEYLTSIGLLNGKHTFKTTDLQPFIQTIIKCLNLEPEGTISELQLNSLLLHFLSELISQVYQQDVLFDHKKNDQLIREIVGYLYNHFTEPITINDIARDLAINRSYMSRQFHSSIEMTLKAYLSELRNNRAAELLTVSDASLEEIAYQSGFSSPKAFSEISKKIAGCLQVSTAKIIDIRKRIQILKTKPLKKFLKAYYNKSVANSFSSRTIRQRQRQDAFYLDD